MVTPRPVEQNTSSISITILVVNNFYEEKTTMWRKIVKID